MKVEKEDCRNLDSALGLEWLETNGRGGFASGTIAGANTRRYHALLLTARPKVKTVIVRRRREAGPVVEPPTERPVPRQKEDGVKGRTMRDPLL